MKRMIKIQIVILLGCVVALLALDRYRFIKKEMPFIVLSEAIYDYEDGFVREYRGLTYKVLNYKRDSIDDIQYVALNSDIVEPQNNIVGGFIENQLDEETLKIFEKAMEGSEYSCTAISVETQVVAGINYRYTVECQLPEVTKARITIFKPLNDGAPIIKEYEKIK